MQWYVCGMDITVFPLFISYKSATFRQLIIRNYVFLMSNQITLIVFIEIFEFLGFFKLKSMEIWTLWLTFFSVRYNVHIPSVVFRPALPNMVVKKGLKQKLLSFSYILIPGNLKVKNRLMVRSCTFSDIFAAIECWNVLRPLVF